MHVFHHIGDISTYKRFSLDQYDSVILAGDFQMKSIRALEKLRNLKTKKLYSLGLLYLDDLYQKKPVIELNKLEQSTILVGSSWGKKGCLRTYGTKFINQLTDAGYHVIIRPHPQSAITEPEFIAKCKQETNNPLVIWDEEISPSHAMHKSQLLISDTSSLRFDYAFLYAKPIITLQIPKDDLSEFEATDLDEFWHESAAHTIGAIANHETIMQLPAMIKEVLNTHTSLKLQSFKQQTVMNFGQCAPNIVEHINNLRKEEET